MSADENGTGPTKSQEFFEAELRGILEKYVPVSEERLDKLWTAVRETMDAFTAELAERQIAQVAMSGRIDTLNNLNQQQQVAIGALQANLSRVENLYSQLLNEVRTDPGRLGTDPL